MDSFINTYKKQFTYYKNLGEKTFSQLDEEELFWFYNEESNSIAIIVNHIAGNMLSRFTNFLTSDGEKEWRNRDKEFENVLKTKKELLDKWNTGWSCLEGTLKNLNDSDLEKLVYIRNMGHTVNEALNRQLAHYAYHIGQIVFIGRMIQGKDWQSLSIAKGQSKKYNAVKFAKPKSKKHFTDDL